MDALVIGAGPAGLMAAEELALAGRKVVVAEAKPTPARKFLMAGKSGLNVTKDEPPDTFAAAFNTDWLAPILADFGPEQVAQWCRDLGQDVFTGSSGRVFPKAMKASPLLRAWLQRLAGQGVDLRTRWRWQGWEGDAFRFATPEGPQLLRPRVTVLALGGASWSRLGSDAAWVPWMTARGVSIAPFRPANMGFGVDWSAHMAPNFGQPIKSALLSAGGQQIRGEFVLSSRGVEGSAIYALSRFLRDGVPLTINLLPDLAPLILAARIARLKRTDSQANRLRKLGLSAAAAALVMEFGRGLPLEQSLTALPIALTGPRPMDEAISVAGGITRDSLTEGLELRTLPGVYASGEMLDWEAPTGGYLLTACWATGKWAGRRATLV
ncbi:MAG: TIGR03862 family flavoprotein [Pseudotabrizicola sp.]|uniref:TIGR03862 family flavoprotein n=1 Tax=Pseudotabrizicola sp. TaxID=2939647 RepID=UPI002730E05C|nr:TIGR03862 family flavoprotein [Pseudotabrizicola sp.]MDP2082455.1 TIGR03862 family flavoprotein [Pseudotabrizicola sp.]MDZ7574208.1 TIGR03862 family flavoprotein [Pseudotabrizicola sp.]